MRQQSPELDQNCARRKQATISTFLLMEEISSVTAGLLYPERFLQATQTRERKMREEKGNCSGIGLQSGRIKGEREYSLQSFHRFYPPWMKVKVENKHPQMRSSLQIHMTQETHAADRCWLIFYLFYLNSPREICWIEVISSAVGVKTLLMKQPRWKVTFVFPAFSWENSWRSGNTALNATRWHLKQLLCFIK